MERNDNHIIPSYCHLPSVSEVFLTNVAPLGAVSHIFYINYEQFSASISKINKEILRQSHRYQHRLAYIAIIKSSVIQHIVSEMSPHPGSLRFVVQ